MSSKAEILNSLFKLVRSMSIIKAVPFDCNISQRSILPIYDNRIIYCYIFPVNSLLYLLFQVFRYFQYQQISFDEKVIDILLFFGYTLGTILQFHVMFYRHQVAKLLTRFQRFIETHKCKFTHIQ